MFQFLKSKSPLAKRMKIMVIALIIFFGLLFGYNFAKAMMIKIFMSRYQPPPVAVSATKAVATTWHPVINTVGTLVAVNGVQLNSQQAGQLIKINFTSGQMVKAGDPLVQLDDAIDQQDLLNYSAQLKLAQVSYNRLSKLLSSKVVAQAEVDKAQAKLQEAQSAVNKTKVIINQKNIVAPFAGKIGIRLVNLGQFIAAGTPIVSLQSLDPLYVQFSLPEQNLPQLYVGQDINVKVDGYKGKVFHGKINAINANVNTDTHNILVQATLANPQLILYPGMFANVEVILPSQQQVITVPQTSIYYNLYGDSAFIIKETGKDKKGKPILTAKQVFVKVGEARGNEVAILKGISANDEVITSGQLKLHDGAQVVINNEGAPENKPTVTIDKPY